MKVSTAYGLCKLAVRPIEPIFTLAGYADRLKTDLLTDHPHLAFIVRVGRHHLCVQMHRVRTSLLQLNHGVDRLLQ